MSAIRQLLYLCLLLSFSSIDVSGNQYIFVDMQFTASNAETYCVNTYGSHLATISSASDNAIASSTCPTSAVSCWIGISDINTEGTFTWLDGSPVVYTNWAPAEPNDVGGTEDCVEIGSSAATTPQQWNDKACTLQNQFLCNSAPTLQPTSLPSAKPTTVPTTAASPTLTTTAHPTTAGSPTLTTPTARPTNVGDTAHPTVVVIPTALPTFKPTIMGDTAHPTTAGSPTLTTVTAKPTNVGDTAHPTAVVIPTSHPTNVGGTAKPTFKPTIMGDTAHPTVTATTHPTTAGSPTLTTVTARPTNIGDTAHPTTAAIPTSKPTFKPTNVGDTAHPTTTGSPTLTTATAKPTSKPTFKPTNVGDTAHPTKANEPTYRPTNVGDTAHPTTAGSPTLTTPTAKPTFVGDTAHPTTANLPTYKPTNVGDTARPTTAGSPTLTTATAKPTNVGDTAHPTVASVPTYKPTNVGDTAHPTSMQSPTSTTITAKPTEPTVRITTDAVTTSRETITSQTEQPKTCKENTDCDAEESCKLSDPCEHTMCVGECVSDNAYCNAVDVSDYRPQFTIGRIVSGQFHTTPNIIDICKFCLCTKPGARQCEKVIDRSSTWKNFPDDIAAIFKKYCPFTENVDLKSKDGDQCSFSFVELKDDVDINECGCSMFRCSDNDVQVGGANEFSAMLAIGFVAVIIVSWI